MSTSLLFINENWIRSRRVCRHFSNRTEIKTCVTGYWSICTLFLTALFNLVYLEMWLI